MSKKFIVVIILLGILTTIFFYSKGSSSSFSFLNGKQNTQRSVNSDEIEITGDIVQESPSGLQSSPINAFRNFFGNRTGNTMPDYINPPYPTVIKNEALDVDERVYEKNSNFSLVVSDVTRYIYDISSYFLSNGGRIMSSSINTSDKYQSAYLYARVPVDNFDEANIKVKTNIKKVYSEYISSSDETAQQSTSKTELDRLQEEKYGKEEQLWTTYDDAVKQRLEQDIKKLENQIRLEQIRLKSIESKTSWASIKITVSNNEKYFKPYNPNETDLSAVFEESLNTVMNILLKGLVLVIQVAVFSLIWLPPLLIIKILFFRKKPNKGKK